MVRVGCESDIDSVLPLADAFWSVTGYEEPFCEESARGFLELSVSQNMLVVYEVDGEIAGFASGIISGLLCNLNAVTGTETAWWVMPEHRGKIGGVLLLRELESQAKNAGVKYWNMVYLQESMPEKVMSIYEGEGYKPVETVVQKRLC